MCRPVPGGTVFDLGSGTGSRTVDLPDALDAARVIGIDSSQTMLAKVPDHGDARLQFLQGDIAALPELPDVPAPDLILSNAALHWLNDHPTVLATWRRSLADHGQLAVQIPVNFDHPSQQLLDETARANADWFGPDGPPELISTNAMLPEQYATILHDLGAVEQQVLLRVYPHELENVLAVVDWLQSTTLRPYRKALDAERYDAFIADFSQRLVDHWRAENAGGDPADGPYLYTFKRILFWAQF